MTLNARWTNVASTDETVGAVRLATERRDSTIVRTQPRKEGSLLRWYRRGAHSKFRLKAHLIFVTKYRYKVFKDKRLNEDVKQFLYEASRRTDCNIDVMETDKDHVHLLIDYSPKQRLSDIAKQFKEYSTYRMWETHEDKLSRIYWKKKILWSDGYFVCSVGEASTETVEKYIKSQG